MPIIRVKRENCQEGPWRVTDQSTRTTRRGSLADVLETSISAVEGRVVTIDELSSVEAEFTYPSWRRKDKRQTRHGVKGKLTIQYEFRDESSQE